MWVFLSAENKHPLLFPDHDVRVVTPKSQAVRQWDVILVKLCINQFEDGFAGRCQHGPCLSIFSDVGLLYLTVILTICRADLATIEVLRSVNVGNYCSALSCNIMQINNVPSIKSC